MYCQAPSLRNKLTDDALMADTRRSGPSSALNSRGSVGSITATLNRCCASPNARAAPTMPPPFIQKSYISSPAAVKVCELVLNHTLALCRKSLSCGNENLVMSSAEGFIKESYEYAGKLRLLQVKYAAILNIFPYLRAPALCINT